jgi:hypothetical protein
LSVTLSSGASSLDTQDLPQSDVILPCCIRLYLINF